MVRTERVGIIVNPVAGMGGSVGLKGTDGKEIIKRAVNMGAVPVSPSRAVIALKELLIVRDRFELITYPCEMGEYESTIVGIKPVVIGSVKCGKTTSVDTIRAAKDMLLQRGDLLLFAGGDGTARDIYRAVGDKLPVLGIPTGVKIHSAVFAINPKRAGEMATAFIMEKVHRFIEAEVMDIDEEAFRKGIITVKVKGCSCNKVYYTRVLINCITSTNTYSKREEVCFPLILCKP